MEQPLISVIIPVYNAAPYLSKCIESIMRQTYTDWELILVDDGSRDNSYDICRNYAEQDTRVRAIHQDNAGVSAARNVGLQEATGEYICFIDSDDYVLDNYLEVLLAEMSTHEADIVFCGYNMQYGERLVERALRVPVGVYTFAELESILIDDGTLTGILFGSACMTLYKATLIKENNILFDKNLRINEDGMFNLQVLPLTRQVYVSAYKGYFYRQWKSRKKGVFGRNSELDKATAAMKRNCNSYADLDLQFQRRDLSVFFWTLLSAGSAAESFWKIRKKLRAFLLENDIAAVYACLDFNKLNRYKKGIMRMALKKRAFLLVVVIRYIYPLMRKFLKR